MSKNTKMITSFFSDRNGGMKPDRKEFRVSNKSRLLVAILNELPSEANISFEGNLSALPILDAQSISHSETSTLRRNTLWPKTDFVVIALNHATATSILSLLGGTIPRSLIHIQIESERRLAFGAYDNFQHLYFGPCFSPQFIDALIAEKLLKR